ncbi:MAG: hypothetical protein KGI67_02680 [Pseudomonadota bacterium]|nr:hypothetical protein [Pseudomonadota bacterium]
MIRFTQGFALAAAAAAALLTTACGGGGTLATGSTSTAAAQTINFSAPATSAAAGATVTLAATSTSGLPVAYSSTTTSVCTVSGDVVTAIAAGTCTIVATQAGNASYAAATSVTQNFSITSGPAAQTITFSPPSTALVIGATATLSGTASSQLPVSYASTTTGVCTVNGAVVTGVMAGTCSITASQAGNSSYQAATPVTQSFAIGLDPQTITFNTPAAPNVGSTGTLTATATSGLTVSFASSTPTVCTVSGTTLSAVASGTCTVTASQSGNATYAAAASVPHTITIGAPAPVAFASGFSSGGLTVEGGGYGGYSGSNLDNFNCTGGPNFCGGGATVTSTTVTAAQSSTYYYYQTPSPSTAEYVGLYVQAPGITALSTTGDTAGVAISGQTTMTFNFNENPEWYSQVTGGSPANQFMVQLTLGKLYTPVAGQLCHILLRAVVAPTTAGNAAYTIPLSSFSVAQTCNVGTATSAAAALALSPISQIDFQGDSGGSAITVAGTATTANTTVPVTVPTSVSSTGKVYPTTLSLKGGITFQ